jgi:hypothetical protein
VRLRTTERSGETGEQIGNESGGKRSANRDADGGIGNIIADKSKEVRGTIYDFQLSSVASECLLINRTLTTVLRKSYFLLQYHHLRSLLL